LAAGDQKTLELEYGLKVERLGLFGDVIVNGKPLNNVPNQTLEVVIRRLRQAADLRHLDPARNPMIKIT